LDYLWFNFAEPRFRASLKDYELPFEPPYPILLRRCGTWVLQN